MRLEWEDGLVCVGIWGGASVGLKRWRICEKGATADNHGRDEGRKCCELRPPKKKGKRGKESDYQYLQLDVGW